MKVLLALFCLAFLIGSGCAPFEFCPLTHELEALGCRSVYDLDSMACVRDDHKPPEELYACTLYSGHGEWVCKGQEVVTDVSCWVCGDNDYPLFDDLEDCGTFALIEKGPEQ